MKVIIAGSRTVKDYMLVEQAMYAAQLPSAPTCIISGGANGVDTLGQVWALRRNLPVRVFRPNYGMYPGHIAPLMRNTEMAAAADALVAVWNAGSRGTQDMITKARARGLFVFIHTVDV